MSNNTTNVSEKGEFVAETLRKLNLKLNAVKEASTKLLPFTTNEFTDMFTSIWEQVFHEKRHSERERMGLFFVAHELLYRSQNKTFQQGFYDILLSCIIQVTTSEHEKLKQEITKLIKLWTDHKIFESQKLIKLTMQLTLEDSTKDELILSQLPDFLPNPPSELIAFAQNVKELEKFKEKSAEIQDKLELLYTTAQMEIATPALREEISQTLSQLKRNLELQNKYRAFTLKSHKEILNIIDKQHMKSVIELKLFLSKFQKVNNIKLSVETIQGLH